MESKEKPSQDQTNERQFNSIFITGIVECFANSNMQSNDHRLLKIVLFKEQVLI